MVSLLTIKQAKSTFHKIMYVYNFVLYRDCHDSQMKEHYYIKVKKHEKGMN
jgi:hypothetical protein